MPGMSEHVVVVVSVADDDVVVMFFFGNVTGPVVVQLRLSDD